MQRQPSRQKLHSRYQSPLVLLVLIFLFTLILGIFLAGAIAAVPQKTKTIEPVPQEYKLAQDVYRERCGTCHLAIPPGVLPTETWRQILQNPQEHYGTKLPRIISPEILLMWNYLQFASRANQETETSYRIADSRYFRALHPRVEFRDRVTLHTCISCHPSATAFDFRELTRQWENSP